jgi:ankyrin repeat protein
VFIIASVCRPLLGSVFTGSTPLTSLALAVELDQSRSVELLLQVGASPDAGSECGSVLHAAAKKRHYEVVSLLLAAKADTEAKYHAGRISLLVALESEVARHHEESKNVVGSLLQGGADANAAVERSTSPCRAATTTWSECLLNTTPTLRSGIRKA